MTVVTPHGPASSERPRMPSVMKSALSGFAIGSRLSLATKLYSIFSLFALLTAAITVLSDYNTRSSTELTDAIETAQGVVIVSKGSGRVLLQQAGVQQ